MHLSAMSLNFCIFKLAKGMTVKLIVFTTSWVLCWAGQPPVLQNRSFCVK